MAEKTKDPTKAERKDRLKKIELRKAEAELASTLIDLKMDRMNLVHRRAEHLSKKHGLTRNGVFRLLGSVSAQGCADLQWDLEVYARAHPGKPVTLYIFSPGGDVTAGYLLYDTLRTLEGRGHHVTTVIRGYAASMGGIIAQAGTTRLMGEESRLHLHEAATAVWGKGSDLKDEAKLIEKMSRQCADIYARRSTLTADEIYKRMKRKEYWLTSAEALEFGFVDEIG